MPDYRAQIAFLQKELEREAYNRGWRDAIAAVKAELTELKASAITIPVVDPLTITADAAKGGKPPKSINLVREIIADLPGLTGVEVVRGLEARGTPVLERTVRTCLRRLREDKIIWQRRGRWYPRPKGEDNSMEEGADTHLL
jgi:hypothetical protein